MIELIALIIGTLVTSLIALTVLAKNSRSITNRLFIGLAVGLVGWSITTYISLHTSSDEATLFWIRWIMFFVVVQNTSFFLLVQVFPANKSDIFKKKRYMLAVAYSVLTALVAISPFLFVGFEDGSPVPGFGMALFLPHALIFALGGLILLIMRFHRSQGIERAQLQYFLAGTLAMFTLVPVGNFIVPVVFKLSQFVILSPFYSIIFSGLIAYAIVAKKMFDIRAAIARALAYVLSLGTIVGAYGFLAFGVYERFVSLNISVSAERAFYVGLAVVSSLFYPRVKLFFDRVTNRIFFRDAYDSQVFLNDLNNLMVAQVELEPLLVGVSQIIERNLKVEYCVFAVRETAYEPVRIIGEGHKKFDEKDIIEIRSITPHIHNKVISIDELDETNQELRKVMRESDISVLVRLVSTLNYDLEGVGYIVLGPKKNANLMNAQDMQVLDIVANELVIAVENSLRFEEIEKFNLTLQGKVDTATHQLQRTNEKLKALDEAKDEFIGMASHQLRTPLTSVKGYLSMVIEGDAGEVSPMQKKLLDQAFTSSQRMVYLIADLLNVSRLRTGKFVIEPIVTNLADVVEGEVHQLAETAKARGLTLTYDKPADFPVFKLDETKLRQVMMNFIDNAIYYAKPKGKIVVSLTETAKTVEYTVVDDGIGVPKSERHNLFTKFYRAGNAKKARPDGTGLGLFMAKKVIVAQGGAIIFKSEEGKGSTFGFSFDKSKLQTPMAKEQLK